MATLIKRFVLILILGLGWACNGPGTDGTDPDDVDIKPMGTLDIAFVYHIQGVPQSRLRKVNLCLAESAEALYKGIYFTCCNVSEAVKHYQFYLPPGEYFYYATLICLCSGDSCKYAGFPGQNGLIAAGGKVTVIEGQTTYFATQFH
jgi:hypothetical protein